MNKNVMAVAVAGVFVAPTAFGQAGVPTIAGGPMAGAGAVQLYGRLSVGYDNYQAKGASSSPGTPGAPLTDASFNGRGRVFDNTSRVGVRGTEDLGMGLRTIFQIESGVNVDSGTTTTQSGAANASAGTWASRDSFIGLDSNYGRVIFGRYNLFYTNGKNLEFSANYVNAQIPWADGTQLGRMALGSAGTNFVARQSNTVSYQTPFFAGMNFGIAYSPSNQEAVQGNLGSITPNGTIWDAQWIGEWGPIYAKVDYAQNKGNSDNRTFAFAANDNQLGAGSTVGGNVQAKWQGLKAGASWAYLPGARIGLIWMAEKSNNVRGLQTGQTAKQQAYEVNWEHTFGNVQLMAEYGQLLELRDCGTYNSSVAPGLFPVVTAANSIAGTVNDCGSGSKATAYMLGARYFFSKRTWVYATFNKTNNNNSQFADYQNAGYSAVNNAVSFPSGADPTIWALGILHNF